jgi:hypothetical protein
MDDSPLMYCVQIVGDSNTLVRLRQLRGLEGWNVRQDGAVFYVDIEQSKCPSSEEAKRRVNAMLREANRLVMLESPYPIKPASLGIMVDTQLPAGSSHRRLTEIEFKVPVSKSGALIQMSLQEGIAIVTTPFETSLLQDLYLKHFTNDDIVKEVIYNLRCEDAKHTRLFQVYERIAIDLATNGLNPKLPNQKHNIEMGRTLLTRTHKWATVSEISSFTTSMHPNRHAGRSGPNKIMDDDPAYKLMARVVISWLQFKLNGRKSDSASND